jgi:hypothetical protein
MNGGKELHGGNQDPSWARTDVNRLEWHEGLPTVPLAEERGPAETRFPVESSYDLDKLCERYLDMISGDDIL